MNKTVWVVAMALMAGSLGGWGWWQYRQVQVLRQELALVRSTVKSGEAANRVLPRESPPQTVTPVSPVTPPAPREAGRTRSAGARAPGTLPPAQSISALTTNKANPLAAVMKMMASPAMKGMIKEQSKLALENNYGPLFKGMGLSAETEESFRALLLDKQMALLEPAMAMMAQGAKAEDRKQLASRIEDQNKGYDEKIKSLLGAENYDLYKQYEDTQPERMQVRTFKGGLTETCALSESQEDLLIRAFHEERSKSQPSASAGAAAGMMPDMSESAVRAMDQLQDRYLQRAGEILNPDQLAAFKQHQEQQRAMQKLGVEMARQMLGGGKDSGDGNIQMSVNVLP